jgi:predicted nuclease of predicted toxin-antitoxin system
VTFFLDHDVPDEAARLLRNLNHEVVLLREVLPQTTSDPEVFAYAIEHDYLLLTCNRDDFLDLARGQTHPGIVILIRRRTRQAEAAHLIQLIEKAGENGLRGNINFA